MSEWYESGSTGDVPEVGAIIEVGATGVGPGPSAPYRPAESAPAKPVRRPPPPPPKLPHFDRLRAEGDKIRRELQLRLIRPGAARVAKPGARALSMRAEASTAFFGLPAMPRDVPDFVGVLGLGTSRTAVAHLQLTRAAAVLAAGVGASAEEQTWLATEAAEVMAGFDTRVKIADVDEAGEERLEQITTALRALGDAGVAFEAAQADVAAKEAELERLEADHGARDPAVVRARKDCAEAMRRHAGAGESLAAAGAELERFVFHYHSAPR